MNNFKSLMRQLICRNRRSFLVKKLAQLCDKFLSAYFNEGNWGFNDNGERFVLQRLRQSLQPQERPRIIFDVGARTGQWTIMTQNFFPDATYYCFEIVPSLAKMLSQTFAGNPQVRINHFGLSNRDGQVFVQSIDGIDIDRFGGTYIFDEKSIDNPKVLSTVKRGDIYIKENHINSNDYLKIDTEGADMDVIKGFASTLRDGRIKIIQFEYLTSSIITKNLLYDYYSFFESNNLIVGKIYPNYVEFKFLKDFNLSRDENFRASNFLAIRNDNSDLIKSLSQ